MTLLIRHFESFAYNDAAMRQFYVQMDHGNTNGFVTPTALGDVQLLQWGRGTGSGQGWSHRGSRFGVRMSSLKGLTGAVASGIGIAAAFNQGGNLGGSILCDFWDDDGHGDGSFSAAVLHLSIETLPDGRIVARNGAGYYFGGIGPIIGSPSTYVMPTGADQQVAPWTHVEVIPVIHASAGSVLVYADGVLVLNLTGVATRNTETPGSGKIGYAQVRADGNRGVTDWVTTNGDGRIGDKRVSLCAFAAVGTYSAGTPTGGATAVECLSDVTADGDTKYVLLDGTGLPKAVSGTTAALPPEAQSIYAVSPLAIARKDDGGTSTWRPLLISGATEDDGGADIAAPTGFSPATLVAPMRIYDTDPNTSAAWTIPNRAASEVGLRRTA